MALVARMVAQEVTARNSVVWTPTDENDPDAKTTMLAFSNYSYGIPFWLREASHVRQDTGKGSESFKLSCVRSGGEDDPNNEFFTASPNGELSMTIENPAAMGYVKPGDTYRVTIEKIRGPRDAQ